VGLASINLPQAGFKVVPLVDGIFALFVEAAPESLAGGPPPRPPRV
jgi:hypothetical protein